jgi:hypothetical protein
MSIPEVEMTIKENGPRVRKAYGQAYFAGWCMGLRKAATEKSSDPMEVRR